MKELIAIQTELSAPKTKVNPFFKGTYRSAEDIFQAIKPLLKEHQCFLNCTDEIVSVEGRLFIRATAALVNSSGESVSASALAELRTPDKNDRLDPAQMTGSASSYARKYALGGLLAIDDNKDPDDPSSPHYKSQRAGSDESSSAKGPRSRKLTDEKYRKLLQMAADGLTIEGLDARDWYESNCAPGATALKLFDREVAVLRQRNEADDSASAAEPYNEPAAEQWSAAAAGETQLL